MKADDEFPYLDWYGLRLSPPARHQLAEVMRAARRNGGRRALRNFITNKAYDFERGLYIPVTVDVRHSRKLPSDTAWLETEIDAHAARPFSWQYFANPLVFPRSFTEAPIDGERIPVPTLRVANGGFLIVTMEFDCETAEQFEETLSWTRVRGRSQSPLATVDRELADLKEYRGYSVVFSGRRSLHYNFVFDTRHLERAPFDASAESRMASHADVAALMDNAHGIVWDYVEDVVSRILRPSLAADRSMRSVTQWKRAPWGVRVLDSESVLGMARGDRVVQMVVAENIRTRAARGSTHFLLPPAFSASAPPRRFKKPKGGQKTSDPDRPEVLAMIQEACAAEWGAYPRPVQVSRRGDEWVINFQNSAGDKNPSSVVIGEHRQLMLNGRHDFGERKFFLPDGMCAQEFVDHAALRLGLARPATEQAAVPPETMRMLGRGYRALRAIPGLSVMDNFIRPAELAFEDAVSERSMADTYKSYRAKLRSNVLQTRELSHHDVIRSVEGAGKTHALLDLLAGEARDEGARRTDGTQRFAAFAFRSRDQARERAAEFGRSGYRVAVVRSFRDHYEEACEAEGVEPLARDDVEGAVGALLGMIRHEQPRVFRRLEEMRKALWTREVPFDAGLTLLAMTHRAAQTWSTSVLTRAWHHPGFDPDASDKAHHLTKEEFKLSRIVFDDPEVEDFVLIMKDSLRDALQRLQGRHANWRNLARDARLQAYRRARDAGELPGRSGYDFDSFDELMRIDLDTLDPVTVDFDAAPFGFDSNPRGIYRSRHGDTYHVGPKPWLSTTTARCTFLTTEVLVAEAVRRTGRELHEKRGGFRLPTILVLDRVPPIFPVRVPIYLDLRASANQAQERVSALAREILQTNPEAVVIADGGRSGGATTFQAMKGLNGLADRDVYVVPTALAPERFAELNVVGQWIGRPDVIGTHYLDQINQAVGRNRGFRQSSARDTRTAIVASPRLWRGLLRGLSNSDALRAQLYEVVEAPWGIEPPDKAQS